MPHPTLFEQDLRPLGNRWSGGVHELTFTAEVRTGSVKRPTVAAGEGASAIDHVDRYLEETLRRPGGKRRGATSASMAATASGSGGRA